MSLDERAKAALNEMYEIVDTVDIEGIKADGITIRNGAKLIKLEVVHEEKISIEDEVRQEIAQHVGAKMEEIKHRLNQRLNDALDMTEAVRIECETKERELRKQLKNAQLMPNITKKDAEKGISVVKGSGPESYIWLIRGIYWPKYYITNKVDAHKESIVVPLKEAMSKRMMSEVIFYIETTKNQIIKVSTRKPLTLKKFDHYHQRMTGSDCWGVWKHPATFKSVEDLLKVAKSASSVLETINSTSMANENPKGLPRKTTLIDRGLQEQGVIRKQARLDQEHVRLGINEDDNAENDDVWTT